MEFNEQELKLEMRLEALRQLLAFALAASHRDLPDADGALREFKDSFISDWADIVEKKTQEAPVALKAALIAEYNKEVTSVMDLATVMVTKMQPAS